mmetsp:Transcript_61269/g.175765  ORF Transcript_61269/g.175765 Transcript_61269/m.175765 type:complete len:286 (+) Transcript_61269:1403-2260(+)
MQALLFRQVEQERHRPGDVVLREAGEQVRKDRIHLLQPCGLGVQRLQHTASPHVQRPTGQKGAHVCEFRDLASAARQQSLCGARNFRVRIPEQAQSIIAALGCRGWKQSRRPPQDLPSHHRLLNGDEPVQQRHELLVLILCGASHAGDQAAQGFQYVRGGLLVRGEEREHARRCLDGKSAAVAGGMLSQLPRVAPVHPEGKRSGGTHSNDAAAGPENRLDIFEERCAGSSKAIWVDILGQSQGKLERCQLNLLGVAQALTNEVNSMSNQRWSTDAFRPLQKIQHL